MTPHVLYVFTHRWDKAISITVILAVPGSIVIYIVDYQIPLNQYLTFNIKIIGALKTSQHCRPTAHKQGQVSTSLKYKQSENYIISIIDPMH
jgi:hypothetical protein